MIPAHTRWQGIYQCAGHVGRPNLSNPMKRTQFLIPALAAVLLLGASCTKTTDNTNTSNSNQAAQAEEISYTGQAGKNALELLAQSYAIESTPEGFVNEINGRRPADRQFWAFYVNGAQASVGAKDYITTDTDQIRWVLESY